VGAAAVTPRSRWCVPGRAERGGDRGIATLLEARQAPLERPPLDQDMALAGATSKADVGAEPIHEPEISAAWMAPPEPDDIAEEQLEHGSVGHAARA
jgi:hypothetical protein